MRFVPLTPAPTIPRNLRRSARTAATAALLALVALAFGALPASAQEADNRFGPPWMARVTAEAGTVVYASQDRSSIVGPLPKEAIVIVTSGDQDGMRRVLDGWVPSSDVAERREPYVAEVVQPSVAIYSKPLEKEGIRKTVRQGDLLRVTGVSPGLEGDPNTWWATTEGYVKLNTIRGAEPANEWAQQWTLPAADEAPGGWWGQVANANVRAGPSRQAPIVGEFGGGERVKVLGEVQGERVAGSTTWYRLDGGRYAGAVVHSSLVQRIAPPRPNTQVPARLGPTPRGTWIVVDRPAKSLTLVRDGQAQFTTYVALGKAGVDTPPGDYQTFGKFKWDDMTSTSVPDATGPYDLPNVPSVQYFKDGGYAVHATYWHDYYGTNQSQGCINVTWADGAYLFSQTTPRVEDSANMAWSGEGAPGTWVVIVG